MRAGLNDAIALWRHGRHQEAERACTMLLTARTSDAIGARGLLAEIYSARGQYRAASEQLQHLAELEPHNAAGWRRLGDAQFANNDFEQSARSFRRAIELEPNNPRGHNNLGRALARTEGAAQALPSYRRALELNPDYSIAHNNLGMALVELDELSEALTSYRRAIELNGQFAEAIANQGNVLQRLGRGEKALECFERALKLQPAQLTVMCNCGSTLLQLRRPQQALAIYDHALKLLPDYAPAFTGRGNALKELRRFDEALEAYERALKLAPRDIDTHLSMAGTLLDLERFEKVAECCERLRAIEPDQPRALLLQGLASQYRGGTHLEDAVRAFARLRQVAPDTQYALGALLHNSSTIFDWSHDGLVDEIVERIAQGKPAISPLAMLAMSDSASLQLQCARITVEGFHAVPASPTWPVPTERRDKIRIAYISGDFRDHPLAYLMIGVFEKHDRDRFEVIGVSLSEPVGNAFGFRILNSLDLFIDARKQTDEEVAQLLRDCYIDIAIDLSGITRGNRLNILANRAAPIQVNYLGYPATMGASFIDYIVADDFVIPPDSRQHYAEKVAYLPDCYQANDDRRAIDAERPSRVSLGLPEQGFVFCSFNSCYKITPHMFGLWCRLLRARPGSVLWMLAESLLAETNLRAAAERQGIDPNRLVFAGRLAYDRHLARLQVADLFLDAFPFTAGTTASDALWAGLPVLTLPGEAFPSRMAGSLLRAVGLPELIAHDLEHYEERALQLSGANGELKTLRARLAQNRGSSPLFDTERFTRHLETAYELMHARRQRGDAPDHIQVPAVGQATSAP